MYCSALVLLCAVVFGHALTNEPTVEKNLNVDRYDDRTANTRKGQLFKRGIFANILQLLCIFNIRLKMNKDILRRYLP